MMRKGDSKHFDTFLMQTQIFVAWAKVIDQSLWDTPAIIFFLILNLSHVIIHDLVTIISVDLNIIPYPSPITIHQFLHLLAVLLSTIHHQADQPDFASFYDIL